jgi:hypothetical protein
MKSLQQSITEANSTSDSYMKLLCLKYKTYLSKIYNFDLHDDSRILLLMSKLKCKIIQTFNTYILQITYEIT